MLNVKKRQKSAAIIAVQTAIIAVQSAILGDHHFSGTSFETFCMRGLAACQIRSASHAAEICVTAGFENGFDMLLVVI